MFSPTSTINPGADWMLQSVNKNTNRQRAVALTAKGNEHSHTLWGERETESAEFTLGGQYSGNVSLPKLGENGVTDFTFTYSETEYPKLSVSRDNAAGGGEFSLPFSLPARTIGVPSAIPGLYTEIGAMAVKQIEIAVSCQHVEETDGSGNYGTLNGMHDATVTVTFTGVSGKPAPTMADGWSSESDTATDSNTAIGGGTITYTKHFAVGTDTDAANQGGAGE